MRTRARIALMTALAVTMLLLPGAAIADQVGTDNPWPVDDGDGANSGQAPSGSPGPVQPVPLWAEIYPDYTIGGIIGGTAGGRARMVTDNDGNLLVRAKLNSSHPQSTSGVDHVLLSIDHNDGSVNWEALRAGGVNTSSCLPAVAPDGTIYTTIRTGEGVAVRLVGLDSATGQQIGAGIDVRRGCTGSLQFTNDGDLLYVEETVHPGDLEPAYLRAYAVSGGTITQVWMRPNNSEDVRSATASEPLQRATHRPVVGAAGTPAAGSIYWMERLTPPEGASQLKLRRLNASNGASTATIDLDGRNLSSMHADPAGGLIVHTVNRGNNATRGHIYRFVDDGGTLRLDWSQDIVFNTDGDRLRSYISPRMVLAGDHLVGWYRDVDRIFGLDWRTGEYRWEMRPPGSGGFSGQAGMLAADVAGNVYYERFGGPLIGSVDPNGNVRGEMSGPLFEGRVGYFTPTTDGRIYVARGGSGIGVALLEEGLDLDGCLARYDDVPSDVTHAEAICSVSLAQIAGGFGDGTFRPAAPVTRAQMATFIARAFPGDLLFPGDPLFPGDLFFPDVEASSVHAGSILALANEGVVGGFGDGAFRPAAPVTRAQMATFIDRAFLSAP